MHNSKLYFRILVNFLLSVALVLLLLFVVPKLLRFFMPFVIAFLISMIANPVVRFMEKKMKILRKHGSAIMIVLVLAVIVGLIYLLGMFLVREVSGLIQEIPNILGMIERTGQRLAVQLSDLINKLPEGLKSGFSDLHTTISDKVMGMLQSDSLPSLSDAGNYVTNVIEFLFHFIITFLASYFMISYRDEIYLKISQITPESVKNAWKLVTENFSNAVGGYFKAQFKLMIVITIILFAVFEILGVSYSFLLALLVGFLDFLPVFGTGTVLGPWILFDLINANYKRAIILAVLYLVCQLVKQLLQPKMVGDSVGIHPFAALFFMFVGYRFGGVLGLIFGIPIGMILVSFYKIGMFDRLILGFKIIARDINNFRKF